MITSRRNSLLAQVRSLSRRKHRDELGLFLVEGRRQVETVIDAGAEMACVLLREDLAEDPLAARLTGLEIEPVVVCREVFDWAADTVSPDGVMALARTPQPPTALEHVEPLVIADELRDPGNLGTLLRTADAVGAGVILIEGTVDALGPKVVRASAGAVIRVPWQTMGREQAGDWLEAHGYAVLTLDANATGNLLTADLPRRAALVIGNEAHGVHAYWRERGQGYRLPMRPGAESLNAAVAAAIALYQVVGAAIDEAPSD